MIEEIAETLAVRSRAGAHLKEIVAKRDQLVEDLKDLKEILKKEQDDVNKLTKMSVNSMFRLFLRDPEQQLEIEQQEYVVAALRYNECIESIELLEYEMRVVEGSLGDEEDLERRQKELLLKKEILVRDEYPHIATMLNNIDYKIVRRKQELREVEEAQLAGRKAEEHLISVVANINKVDAWGSWKAVSNYQSHYSKKSFIDRTRELAVTTGVLLSSFEDELKDVFSTAGIKDDLTIEAFDTFLMVFYDNMVTDWIVQSHLRHTRNAVEATHAKLGRLMASLKHQAEQLTEQIEELRLQRREHIEAQA